MYMASKDRGIWSARRIIDDHRDHVLHRSVRRRRTKLRQQYIITIPLNYILKSPLTLLLYYVIINACCWFFSFSFLCFECVTKKTLFQYFQYNIQHFFTKYIFKGAVFFLSGGILCLKHFSKFTIIGPKY